MGSGKTYTMMGDGTPCGRGLVSVDILYLNNLLFYSTREVQFQISEYNYVNNLMPKIVD